MANPSQGQIDKAAQIIETVAEPSHKHTNEGGALFIQARAVLFAAAGVTGFTPAVNPEAPEAPAEP